MIFKNISELPGLDRALIQNRIIAQILRIEFKRSDNTIPGWGRLAESRDLRRAIY